MKGVVNTPFMFLLTITLLTLSFCNKTLCIKNLCIKPPNVLVWYSLVYMYQDNNKMKKLYSILILPAALLLTACAGKVPTDLGMINDSELRPCPDKPNCVQTYDPADESHFQLPLAFNGDDEQTKLIMVAAITETGGKIIHEKSLAASGYYLHAEYESDWLKFIDDVEVVINDGMIHIRSASRLGYSDTVSYTHLTLPTIYSV